MKINFIIINYLSFIITLVGFFGCNSKIKPIIKPTDLNENCIKGMVVLEKNAFLSCPIIKGPDSVISFLEKKSGFFRNKEFDFGNGSVRFNAKNADFLSYKLKDEKSLFLLNYFKNEQGKEVFLLFQAIYYFENEDDKNRCYQNIVHVIENELHLNPEIKFTLNGQSYKRYYLSCGSGFNLKHSEVGSDSQIIDILWMPEYSQKIIINTK